MNRNFKFCRRFRTPRTQIHQKILTRPGPAKRFLNAYISGTTGPILFKFCTIFGTSLNYRLSNFGVDTSNRKAVSALDAPPTKFQYFAYNSKTIRNFEILRHVPLCRILRSTILMLVVISKKWLENGQNGEKLIFFRFFAFFSNITQNLGKNSLFLWSIMM